MNNIIGYAQTYHETFEDKPFSEVDSLVLSQLSYLRLENSGLTRAERYLQLGSLAAEMHNDALMRTVPSKNMMLELMYAVATSPRLRWLAATQYATHSDVEIDKQFSATTYLFEDGTVYVAFRGTDGTVVGWRENFNMTFLPAVPSQEEAAAYLETIADRYKGSIYVGGHSKGGNLAVYAAACCRPETQARILAVFSHDGPGFQPEFFAKEGYHRIKDRIRKTVPESAIIGMLLQHQEPYTVIESMEHGIFQHRALTWVVEGGRFSEKERVSKAAQAATNSFNSWAETLDVEQRKLIVDALFEVIRATNASTLKALAYDTLRNMPTVVKAVSSIDPATKQLLYEKLGELETVYEQVRKEQ